MKRLLLLVGMVLALHAAQAAELYRWVDKSGKVHYGDTPDDEDAEKLKISPPASTEAASGVDEGSMSYEARLARQKFPVTLYVTEKCGDLCNQARDFLRKRKVPFSETVMKTQEDFDTFKQKTGMDAIPALSVGRTWLKGFQAGQWRDELDAAGYPN